MAVSPVPENASDWWEASTHETDSLVVLNLARYDRIDGDVEVWADHVALLERDWFKPCQRMLQTGELAALHLYGGQSCWHSLTRAARWRFWRRNRSVVG